MRLFTGLLMCLMAFSISSCRLTGKGAEDAAPSLETQLTPVKPAEEQKTEAEVAKEAEAKKPKAN